MTREEFPKIKKGDILSDGNRKYLVLKLKNCPEYDAHRRHVGWINGFIYLDTDGFEKFQEYNSKEFMIVGHSKIFRAFLRDLKKELV